MVGTEVRRKYIPKTYKSHSCMWCGSQIDSESEAWIRYYDLVESERDFGYLHPECMRAADLAETHEPHHVDWFDGCHMRGEWLHPKDDRYPHRSVWHILRQIELFDRIKVGDWVHSSIAPKIIRRVDAVTEDGHLIFDYHNNLEILNRDEWVLDDWSKTDPIVSRLPDVVVEKK